jgi:hypothetical protein
LLPAVKLWGCQAFEDRSNTWEKAECLAISQRCRAHTALAFVWNFKDRFAVLVVVVSCVFHLLQSWQSCGFGLVASLQEQPIKNIDKTTRRIASTLKSLSIILGE